MKVGMGHQFPAANVATTVGVLIPVVDRGKMDGRTKLARVMRKIDIGFNELGAGRGRW